MSTMPKYYPMQNTDSSHSIDLSKPDGMSSFWNLFSKNNKKEDGLQIVNDNDKQQIKLNGVALKILKLKGIDLTNIDRFEKSEIHSLKQNNKVVVINPNQINLNKKDFLKENRLFNVINNQKSSNDIRNIELNVMSSTSLSIKSGTGLIKSSITYLKSKKPNIYTITNKKGLQENEKDDKTFNLCPTSLNESHMFKSVPEGKPNKRPKKRVIVPVYVGKKKNSESNNLEKESFLNCRRQDETFDVSSLITKIKTLEEQLNSLKCKSKINKPFQLETGTLVTKRAETINYSLSKSQPIKQSNENDKENIFTEKSTEKHKNTTLSNDCTEDDQKKKAENIKQGIENFVNTLNNPDILIKNHNLIIPGDFSQESLFQANPCAGCDTILKLFNTLSEKANYINQAKNTTVNISGDSIQESSQISNCDSENFNTVDKILSHFVDGTNNKTEYENNTDEIDIGGIEEHLPISSSDSDLENNCCERNNNGFKNIFSLPLNLSTLKTFDLERSHEEKQKVFQEATSNADILIKSHDNIVEDQSVCANDLKEKLTIHTSISKQSNTSIQNLQTNVSQTAVISDRFEKENYSEKIVEETSIKNNSVANKSSERRLDKIKIDLKKNTSSHQLQYPSPVRVQKEVASPCHEISVGTINGGTGKCDVNMINISHEQCKIPGSPNQQKKMFKKTTISCPVQSPCQNVSITILIENPLIDKRDIECSVSTDAKIPSFIKLRDIDNSSSSLDLKKETVLQKEQNGKVKNVHVAEEPGVIDSLSLGKITPSINGKITYCDVISSGDHEQSMFKQNYCEKREFFGLTSDATYLTKEQRKALENKLPRVDHFEGSINLCHLKLERQTKIPFPNLNYECSHKKMLSQSCSDSQEVNPNNQCKINTRLNRKILHKSGTCKSSNPFYKESFIIKKQSKTKLIQQDNSFGRNKEIKSIIHGCSSTNNINIPSHPKNKNELKENQQHLKPLINNYWSSPESRENSDSVYLKKRSCRFNLTINQETLLKEAANNHPSLKSNEEVSQQGGDKINKIDYCSYNKSGTNQLKLVSNSPNEELKLLQNSYGHCSPINELLYKTVMCVQTDFNNVEESKNDSHSCDPKLVIPPEITASNIAERKVENFVLTGRNIERNCLGAQLSNLQYEKVGNEVQGTAFNHENKLIQQNNFQRNQLVNPDLLNHFEIIMGNSIMNNYSDSSNCSSKSDAKVICQKAVKHFSSQNEFNEASNNKLQNVKVKPEITYRPKSNKATHCCCCTSGCLFIPDDFSDNAEE